MPSDAIEPLLAHAARFLDAAKRAGASAADVLVVQGTSLTASYRLGKLEDVERSEGHDVGLRVFVGQRQAAVSSTDLSPAHVTAFAERAVAMARLAPEDPYCGLADPALLARTIPVLDLADPAEPDVDTLARKAAEAEEAALQMPKIANSEGASAGFGRTTIALATSTGFAQGYSTTLHNLSCSVVASEDQSMERDYDFTSARHESDLDAPAAVGRSAARLAAQRLSPRKVKSAKVPIVYDPRVARTLLGHFAGAINGAAIARGVSFLKDDLGKPVFAPAITIIDDPHRCRGLASRPFDGEGVANKRLALVENGVLQSWILDTASAKQLGLTSTGHAARGTGGPPSPATTNLYLEAGTVTPAALIADIKDGFYVTELIGMGVNGVTGDYSRGACGFWIENGRISYPVNEVTVAGNLREMFRALVPANDLVFRYGTNAPTVRIDGMTVAGT